jgi:hypothetical protein
MFASTRENARHEAGFSISARMRVMEIWRRTDEMAVFYVVAIALLCAVVIPAWQASQVTPVVQRAVVTSDLAAKGDRLRRPAIDIACESGAYGNETAECLVAIARDSGRDGAVRIVEFEARNG